jgi:hypothetical protein
LCNTVSLLSGSRPNYVRLSHIKFHENAFTWSRVATRKQIDRQELDVGRNQTHLLQLFVENEPKVDLSEIVCGDMNSDSLGNMGQ